MSSRKDCVTKNRLHSLLHLTAFMLVVAFSCPAFAVSPDVVISHYPAQADMLTGESTLILAGHSHGGQVRLPLFGPLVLPPEVGSYDMGLLKLRQDSCMLVQVSAPLPFRLDSTVDRRSLQWKSEPDNGG